MEISLTTTDLDALSVNTIRGLCMDAIAAAGATRAEGKDST
jgi:hypothetical protein